jgi:DNA-binding transcriptional MerR regulator
VDGSRLLIGDLAQLVGMSASALRHYEGEGLLEAESRTESGYRVFGPTAAYRLLFIKRAKALGLTLSEIKRLIDAPRGTRDDERAFFDRFIDSKIKETQARIAGLRAVVRDLKGLDAALSEQPPPEYCHLGDCACWVPA